MAKQQYYFRKKPTPLFPAFNSAVIDVMPSMFAYLQAQAIINAGESNNEYGDTVNLYPLSEETGRRAYPGNQGNVNTYGFYSFVRPHGDGKEYVGGETPVAGNGGTQVRLPDAWGSRKYQFNAGGLAFAGWGDTLPDNPGGALRSVVEWVDAEHPNGIVSTKDIPFSKIAGDTPKDLHPELSHVVNVGGQISGNTNPGFYWHFDAKKVKHTYRGVIGYPTLTRVSGAPVQRVAEGVSYIDLGNGVITPGKTSTAVIFISTPTEDLDDRNDAVYPNGTTACEGEIIESPAYTLLAQWKTTEKRYRFYARYAENGTQTWKDLFFTTPEKARDVFFTCKVQGTTVSIEWTFEDGTGGSVTLNNVTANTVFNKTAIGGTGAMIQTIAEGVRTYSCPYPGIIRSVRVFNTILADDDINAIKSDPVGFIMPRQWITAFGCTHEFTPDNLYIIGSTSNPNWYNTALQTAANPRFSGSTVFFRVSTRETVKEGLGEALPGELVKTDYCLYASRLFIGTYTSSASPWTLSPWYILTNYDATNYTPATIKVTPEHPNEDVPPVTVGVKLGDSGIEQQRYVGDIAKIARRLFKNIVDELDQQDLGLGMAAMPLYVDYNLIARISVDKVGEFAGLNAVRQLGAGEFTTQGGYFAVDNPVKYPGYPLNLVFVNTQWGADNVVLIIDGEDLGNINGAGVLMAQPLALIKVPEGSTHFIAASLSNDGVSDEIEIGSGCVGDNPFYVQWINDRGGYNSYMFNTRNMVETERTDTVNVQRADISDEFDTQVTASFKIERRITTGVDNLTREDYDKLLGIFKSPRIQWWNEEAEQWVTVLCGDQSNTWDTNSGLGSIEVTFIYPRILLQQ